MKSYIKTDYTLVKKPLLKWVFIILGLFSMFFVSMILSILLLSRTTVLESFLSLMPQTKLSGVNILAFGIDETRNVKRSDTIMVFHLDPDNNRIGALSIPRDTRVNVEGVGLTKINHAYAHGGSSLLQRSVSDFLGIPIDYYMKINIGGVAKIVDELGGVRINVKKDMYYKDMAGDLFINLQKGDQVLNGIQAVQYLRFRQDRQGDIGRIKRQQSFLQSVASSITTPKRIIKLPLIVKNVGGLIDTDLSTGEMINFAVQFSEVFKHGTLTKGTIPGAVRLIDGVSYWRPNISKVDKLVGDVIYGFDDKQIKKKETLVKTEDKSASKESRRKVSLNEVARVTKQLDMKEPIHKFKLKVEILNGFGVPGAAKSAAKYLKDAGVNVPIFGNAGSFSYDDTLLVDWKGNLDRVVSLANLLHIDPSSIIVYDRPDKPLDATLVLGKDWDYIYEKILQN